MWLDFASPGFLLSVPRTTFRNAFYRSERSFKIALSNILHMYTIGAVIMRFRPPFFCFIPIFSKDFKKCSQDVPFLNLAVLFLETTELITVSQISVPRPDLPHTNPSCETNLVSELKSEKQFRKGVSPGDGHLK